MGRSKAKTKLVKANLEAAMEQEREGPKSPSNSDSDEPVDMNDVQRRTPPPAKPSTARKAVAPPKKTPSRKRTPTPDDEGDDSDEDTDSSDTESESETNSDDEAGYDNPNKIWEYFVELCRLTKTETDLLYKAGYSNPDQLETLAYDGKVDTSGLVEEGIDQPVATNIGTFAKFLFLRGDFEQHKTLRSMARFNLQKQDSKGRRSGYYSDEDAAGLMRLSDGKLQKFSNVDEDFEDYWKEAETTLKRTPYGRLLDQPPNRKDTTGKSINKSLHWNLVSAFNGTDAEHVVTEAGTAHKDSGYHTSKAILNYYRSDDRRAEVQRGLRNKITALKLDGSDPSVTGIKAYTNKFKMLVNRLKTAKEKWPDSKLKTEYLKNINLSDGHPLMVMKVICAADVKLKFKDTYERLILADATDEYEAEESNLARARRGQTTEGIKGKHVPEIPEHVLKAARDASSGKGAVSVILKWKRIKNEENRDLRPDELQQKPNPKKESNHSQKKGGKETRKQKRRRLSLSHDEPSKKRRVTKTRQVTAGLKESTVQVSIKDPNDDEPTWTDSASDNSDDDAGETSDNIDNKTSTSKTTAASRKKRRNKRKQRRFKARRAGRKSRHTKGADPNIRTIWDTGTDMEIIGQGWHIDHCWTGHSLTIDGPLEGMDGKEELPIVAGITAHDTKDGPILIGIGVTAYDSRPKQEESLLNPNAISHFCDIDERPTHRDGRQSLITDCGDVKIHVENGRLPYSFTRMPTQRELQLLPINWIVPKCETVLKETLIRARRNGLTGIKSPDHST